MANSAFDQMAQYARQSGMRNPEPQDDKQNEWQKILAMLAMSSKMDAGTMAGFGLGKLLRDGFNSWKNNYDARGFINDELLSASPAERERKLNFLKENNLEQYNRVMNKYGDLWQGEEVPNASQQATGDVTPEVVKNSMLQYAQSLQNNPPATDWGGSDLSKTANDYVEEILKKRNEDTVLTPFSRGW